MSQNSGKAVRAGIGYTIGNILARGVNFLSLPLFSRLMTTEEFGAFNLFISYEAVLNIVLCIALNCSTKSANQEFPGEIDDYSSSVSLIFILNAVFSSALILLFGGLLTNLTTLSTPVLLLMVVHALGSSLLMFYVSRIVLDYSYKKYLVVSFLQSLGNIIFSLLLILTVFRSDKSLGRIIGATVSFAAITVFILHELYKAAKPRFDKKYWKFGIKYSLPLVPHGLSSVLLGQVDKMMIGSMVGNSSLGIYSLAGNIKLIPLVLSDSISNAWGTWFFEMIAEGKKTEIQKRAGQLSIVFMVLTIGLMAISPELILLLGGEKYTEGSIVAIPMIVDAFILFLYGVVVQIEYYRKKTIYIMYGTLATTAIDLILNYIFIRRYGYAAAAYTTLVSYIIFLILHLVIAYRLEHFNVIPMKILFLTVAVTMVSGGVSILLQHNWILRYLCCLVTILPAFLWFLKNAGDLREMVFGRKGTTKE